MFCFYSEIKDNKQVHFIFSDTFFLQKSFTLIWNPKYWISHLKILYRIGKSRPIHTISDKIDSMWSPFCSMFMSVVDKHMPIKERRILSDSEKWINDEILSEMRQSDILHRRAPKSRDRLSSDLVLYKVARCRVVAKLTTRNET